MTPTAVGQHAEGPPTDAPVEDRAPAAGEPGDPSREALAGDGQAQEDHQPAGAGEGHHDQADHEDGRPHDTHHDAIDQVGVRVRTDLASPLPVAIGSVG